MSGKSIDNTHIWFDDILNMPFSVNDLFLFLTETNPRSAILPLNWPL